MKPITHNSHRRRAGFTLIEILVVIVIAAVLAAISLGGYSAMRSSNARTTCQANMAQVYHALRLYTADYNGNAPYYDPEDTLGEGVGVGLWALYGFTNSANSDLVAGVEIKPESRYLKSPKVFHCPWDRESEQLYAAGTTPANSEYNQDYLSYQIEDTDIGQYTYAPIRTTDVSDAGWQRQLLHMNGSNFVSRPPTDNTIIFWCPFHRNRNGGGEDNVLFWDGSVQSIPVDQAGLVGWERGPKGWVE